MPSNPDTPRLMQTPVRLSLVVPLCCGVAVSAFVLGRWTAGGRVDLSGGGSGRVLSVGPARAETPGGEAQGGRIEDVADRMAAVGREQLRRLDGERPSEHREDERLRMIERWAAVDPVAALDYARTNLEGDRRAQALTAVFTTWARHTPRAAWSWVTTHVPGEMPHLDEVIGEIGRSSPSLAAELASSWAQGHPSSGQELYLAALQGMAYSGKFAEASRVIGTVVVRDGEDRIGLVTFLAGQWARYQPAQAADWVKQLPEGATRDHAMMSLSVAWADADPEAAAQFAIGLPAGATRESALQQVVSKWLTVDPGQARNWVIDEGVHDDFDQAVTSIATQPQLMATQPALALQWAGNIIDDSVRFRCLSTVLSNLYARNPASALNYIRSSQDLTPDQRAEFLRRFPAP